MNYLCRDENCDRTELHVAHDDFEIEWPTEEDSLEPWKLPAPEALDQSIHKATSEVYPKPFDVIMRDVEYDYGSCNMRTVQRRLRALVQRGHIIRLDLGRRLYAYVRPGSNMINDIDLVREQVSMMVAT